MRLINADDIVHYWGKVDGKGEWLIRGKDIDLMPTIKAIPIEWIKDYTLRTWLADYDSSELKAIERMLDDWIEEEVENEGCRSR